MCRPACLIIQTGVRSTSSPRAARSKSGSLVVEDETTGNGAIKVAEREKTVFNSIVALLIIVVLILSSTGRGSGAVSFWLWRSIGLLFVQRYRKVPMMYKAWIACSLPHPRLKKSLKI
jgi:hypothetical protein